MFPFVRLVKEFIIHRNAPDLPIDGVHISRHMCLPWDLDMFLELNNGRTLTLFDLGRLVLAKRTGMIQTYKKQGWGSAMAGASVRYRRRVRLFDVVEMRSRVLCFDERFIYIEQSMWLKNGECANHILYRMAVTDGNGIVPVEKVAQAMGQNGINLVVPEWVQKWIEAEDARPWPPVY